MLLDEKILDIIDIVFKTSWIVKKLVKTMITSIVMSLIRKSFSKDIFKNFTVVIFFSTPSELLHLKPTLVITSDAGGIAVVIAKLQFCE